MGLICPSLRDTPPTFLEVGHSDKVRMNDRCAWYVNGSNAVINGTPHAIRYKKGGVPELWAAIFEYLQNVQKPWPPTAFSFFCDT